MQDLLILLKKKIRVRSDIFFDDIFNDSVKITIMSRLENGDGIMTLLP